MASRYSNADLRTLAQDIVKAISTSTSGAVAEMLRIAEELRDTNETLSRTLSDREKLERKYNRLTQEWYDAKKRNQMRELELEAQYQKRMKRAVTALEEFEGPMKVAVQKVQKTFMTMHGDLSKGNQKLLSSTTDMTSGIRKISEDLKKLSSTDVTEVAKKQDELRDIYEKMVATAAKSGAKMRFDVEDALKSTDPAVLKSVAHKLKQNVTDLQDGILKTSKAERQNQKAVASFNKTIEKVFGSQSTLINELQDVRDIHIFNQEMKRAGELAKEYQSNQISEEQIINELSKMSMFSGKDTKEIIDAFKTGAAEQLKQVQKQTTLMQNIRDLTDISTKRLEDEANGQSTSKGGLIKSIAGDLLKKIPGMGWIMGILSLAGPLLMKVAKEIMTDQLAVMKYGIDMKGGVLSNIIAAGRIGINSGEYAKIRAENRGILSNYVGGEAAFGADIAGLVNGRSSIDYRGSKQSVASFMGGTPEERTATMVKAMQTLAGSGMNFQKENIMNAIGSFTGPMQDFTGLTQDQSFTFIQSITSLTENQEMLALASESQREAYVKNTSQLAILGEKMGLSVDATQSMVQEMIKARKKPFMDLLKTQALAPVLGSIAGLSNEETNTFIAAAGAQRGGKLDEWISQGNNGKIMQGINAKIGNIMQNGYDPRKALLESLFGQAGGLESLMSMFTVSARKGGQATDISRTGAENPLISSGVLSAQTVMNAYQSGGLIHTLGAVDGQIDATQVISSAIGEVGTTIKNGFNWLKSWFTKDPNRSKLEAKEAYLNSLPTINESLIKTQQDLTKKHNSAIDLQADIKTAKTSQDAVRMYLESVGLTPDTLTPKNPEHWPYMDMVSKINQSSNPIALVSEYARNTANSTNSTLQEVRDSLVNNIQMMKKPATDITEEEIRKNRELVAAADSNSKDPQMLENNKLLKQLNGTLSAMYENASVTKQQPASVPIPMRAAGLPNR